MKQEAAQTVMAPVAKATSDILYATDFSDASQRALICAKHIARVRGMNVRTVHIIELAEAEGLLNKMQDRAWRELRRVRRDLRLAKVKEFATVITVGGSAARAVCDAVRRYKASLLIIGISGDSFIISSVLGSTAKGILRRATCPVMTVGIRTEDPPSHVFDRVLYVADSDPASLEKALASWPVKNRLEAPYFLVLPPGETPAPATPEEAAIRLQIANPNAAALVLRGAKELKPDLIVFAFKSGGYLDALNAGGFGYKIIGHAPCPVLTVRV